MLGYFTVLCALVGTAVGHGRLIDPPSRSSAWRWGFDNPANYNDNELFCGGAGYQATQNGMCGVCGDPWKGEVEDTVNYANEAGGMYTNGIIVRAYEVGQVIDVTVDLTANHQGWFEFKLCPNNDVTKRIKHDCLNQYPLALAGGFASMGSRYTLSDSLKRNHTIPVQLPSGLSCSQCVLQWRYHTANSWGTDPDGNSCTGCGDQEEFYGCADISIGEYIDTTTQPSLSTQSPTTTISTQAPATTTTIQAPATTTTTQAPATTTTTQGTATTTTAQAPATTTTQAPTSTTTQASTTNPEPTTAATTQAPSGQTCEDVCAANEDGLYAHPGGDCQYYCQCASGNIYTNSCSAGLCFDISCMCCNWP